MGCQCLTIPTSTNTKHINPSTGLSNNFLEIVQSGRWLRSLSPEWLTKTTDEHTQSLNMLTLFQGKGDAAITASASVGIMELETPSHQVFGEVKGELIEITGALGIDHNPEWLTFNDPIGGL
jgi:hypothetical protein